MTAEALYSPPDYFRHLEKSEIFPDVSRRLEVDLGCGDGTFLVDLASHHPERDFLGIERLLGRARKSARKATRRELRNVKVFRIESSYAVTQLLPKSGVHRLHLLFPDPWPKKKHYKKRLVKEDFCAAVHRVLEPGGEWLFKTDERDYFDDALSTIRTSGLFVEESWPDNAFFHPPTDFERQWLGEGREIFRARFRKTSIMDD